MEFFFGIIYIYKIFFGILLFLALSNFFYEAWNELRFNKFNAFREQRDIIHTHSLLNHRVINKQNYSLIDFLFDLYYVTCFLSHKPWKFCVFIFLYALVFVSLWWIPLIYGLLFILSFWRRLAIIVFKWLLKKKYVYILSSYKLYHGISFLKLLNMALTIPSKWADYAVYTLLALKKKKIELKQLEILIFSFLFGKPLWFIKLLFFWSNEIYDIFTQPFWKRKKLRAYPNIFFCEIKTKLFHQLFNLGTILFLEIENKKIIVEDRCIKLNPPHPKLINFAKNLDKAPTFNKPILAYVGDTYHQIFLSKFNSDGISWGWSNTHSKSIKFDLKSFIYNPVTKKYDESGLTSEKIPTSYLQPKQRAMYSAFDLNRLEWREGMLQNFFEANGMYDYENFVGYNLKLKYLYLLNKIEKVIIQKTDESSILIPIPKTTIASVQTASEEINDEIAKFQDRVSFARTNKFKLIDKKMYDTGLNAEVLREASQQLQSKLKSIQGEELSNEETNILIELVNNYSYKEMFNALKDEPDAEGAITTIKFYHSSLKQRSMDSDFWFK